MALIKTINAADLQGTNEVSVDFTSVLTAISGVKTDTTAIQADVTTVKADVAVIKTNTTP